MLNTGSDKRAPNALFLILGKYVKHIDFALIGGILTLLWATNRNTDNILPRIFGHKNSDTRAFLFPENLSPTFGSVLIR